MPKSYSAGISLHKMDGDTNRLKYDEYRIYASKRMDKTDIAVDLLDVKYKEAINNVSNAYSATLAAGYEMTEKLKLGADLEYSKNPDFDKDVRIFLKLNYRFGADLGKREGV
jgi:outer membrane protease